MLPLGGLVKLEVMEFICISLILANYILFFSGNPSIFTMQLQFEGNSLVTFSVLQAAMIIICVY